MTAPGHQPCAVVQLDLADLRRSAQDPALQALLADGWDVLCAAVVQDENGAYTQLVLHPPRKQQASPLLERGFQLLLVIACFSGAQLLATAAVVWALLGL